jgi:hypothetical protein
MSIEDGEDGDDEEVGCRVQATFPGGMPAEVDVKVRRVTEKLEHAEDELTPFMAVVARTPRRQSGAPSPRMCSGGTAG